MNVIKQFFVAVLLLGGVCFAANASSLAEIEALGNKDDEASRGALLAIVQNKKATAEEQNAAVKALLHSHAGALALLKLNDDEKLPDDLKPLAAYLCATSSDDAIRKAAEKSLPVMRSKDGKPLPPIVQLAEMKGDPKAGDIVFHNPQGPNCISCHQMNGDGKLVGPPMDTVGDKLSKAELLTAVLYPSAGIEMGYETWVVKTKSGETKTGILTQDDDTVVTLRDAQGEFQEIPAKDVAKKTKQTISLMPEGLWTSMTMQDLLNLVEFLTTKKAEQ